jgi:DNA-binding transcriptional MocR family regulator
MPEEIDTVKLFQVALRENICIAPGSMFSAKGKYRNFMRLYCGHHDRSTTERAIETLAHLTRQMV